MSALYSVWDIVRFPPQPNTPSIFPSCANHGLWIVRRSHPSQSKYLRRQRFCPEVWRLFTMLGCYLVHHIPCIHDRGNRWWNSRVSRIVQPAAGRLQTLYSNSLKHPIYCTSEAVHFREALPLQGQKSPQRPSFQGQEARDKEQEATGHPPLETGVWLTSACATADKADAKVLGTTNTHAISRREELPPISTPRAWDGCCCG